MTKKQKRLHKLGNAQRALKGGFYGGMPQPKAQKRVDKWTAICKEKGDL